MTEKQFYDIVRAAVSYRDGNGVPDDLMLAHEECVAFVDMMKVKADRKLTEAEKKIVGDVLKIARRQYEAGIKAGSTREGIVKALKGEQPAVFTCSLDEQLTKCLFHSGRLVRYYNK